MSSTKDAEKQDSSKKTKNSKPTGGNMNTGNLEDCFTNVFALTEVNGIRWKCFRPPSSTPRGLLLTEDPIFKAYSKCLQQGIMCAWRRKQLQVSSNNDALPLPGFSIDMIKELWVFWYNDEPEQLSTICTDLEIDEESSYGEFTTTVSYEVRTLFFKSLHVIIERSLVQSGFVRFGRWFTKPVKGRDRDRHFMMPTYSLAIRFNFFVHGGNTICAIVSGQRQPSLIQLNHRHLEYNSLKRFVVIVGPWSMRGFLVPNQLMLLGESKMQLNSEREYNQWREFVQLDIDSEEDEEKNIDISLSSEKDGDDKKISKNDAVDGVKLMETSSDDVKLLENKEKDRTSNNQGGIEIKKEIAESVEKTPFNHKSGELKNTVKQGAKDGNESEDDVLFNEEQIAKKLPKVPKMVLVEIDGVRMLCPSKFICVTLEDDRHIWESMGHRITAVPDELMVQGRKPKNNYVVRSGSSKLFCEGVVQHASSSREILEESPIPLPLPIDGFVRPFLPINIRKEKEKSIRWSFHVPYDIHCDSCTYEKRCEGCGFVDKRLRTKQSVFLSKKEMWNIISGVLRDNMRKPDFVAYHRTQNYRTQTQMIRLKESMGRQRSLTESSKPSTSNEKSEEDEEKSICRTDIDDDPWVLDEDNHADWMDLEGDDMRTCVSPKPSKYFFEDKRYEAPLREGTPPLVMSPVYNSFEDSFSPDVLKYLQEDKEWQELDTEAKIWAGPSSLKIPESPPKKEPIKLKIVQHSTKKLWIHKDEYQPFIKEKDAEEDNTEEENRKRLERDEAIKEKRKMEKILNSKKLLMEQEKNSKIAQKMNEKKSVSMMVRKLSLIRDKRGSNRRRKRNSVSIRKSNENVRLEFLDIKNYSEKTDEEFKEQPQNHVGYISPCYLSTPSYDYSSEGDKEEECAKGLGEGTSSQFSGIESMEIDVNHHQKNLDNSSADVLLSPPASNEMPRGGPLSDGTFDGIFLRGPSSIEGLGMNQIYPTPPSVQMIHNDAQQMHSPIMKILKKEPTAERTTNGGPIIEEVSTSDDENENLKEWNGKLRESGMNKLLSAIRNTKIGRSRRRKHVPLSEKFLTNNADDFERNVKKNGVYRRMIDNVFENPPFDSFGKLVKPSVAPTKSLIPQLTAIQPAKPQMPHLPHQFNPQHQMHQPIHPGQFHPGFPQGPPISGGFSHPNAQYMHPMHRHMMYPAGPPRQLQMRPPMGAPPGYGAPPTPGAYPMTPSQQPGSVPPPSSVQQLNNFVNQARFGGPHGVPPPPYGPSPMMQLLQSPNFGPTTPSPASHHHFGGMQNMNMPYNMMSPQHQMMMRQQQQQNMMQSMYPMMQNNMGMQMQYRPKDPQVPEGESVVIALIMSDTILDLHFDTAMDACPICACNTSIRTRELGLYITPHELLRSTNQMYREQNIGPWSGFHLNSSGSCTCGFSAVRHRYLSNTAGLFPEDSTEATLISGSVAAVAPPLDNSVPGFDISRYLRWFDPTSASDIAVLDQIRQMSHTNSLGKAVAHMASLTEHVDRIAKAVEIGPGMTPSSEYVFSDVDAMELLLLGNAALDMCIRSMSINRTQNMSATKQWLTYFHPWGLQTANEMRNPEAEEWNLMMRSIAPILEKSMRVARSVDAQESVNIVEGPLTWRKFVQKSLKNRQQTVQNELEEEIASMAEPVPAIATASSSESIRAAPSIRNPLIQEGEQMLMPLPWQRIKLDPNEKKDKNKINSVPLAPVDTPKDVMYITIIPDDDVIYTKAVEFMDKLSESYEKMRLGRHIPFPASTKIIKERLDNYETSINSQPVDHNIMNEFRCNVNPQKMEVEEMKTPVKNLPTNEKFAENAPIWEQKSMSYMKHSSEVEQSPAKSKRWEEVQNIFPESNSSKGGVEREGILRVGGPTFRQPMHMAANSVESISLEKNLNDKTEFFERLKTYTEQTEQMVMSALTENQVAYTRYGFRYQSAIELKIKRNKDIELAMNSDKIGTESKKGPISPTRLHDAPFGQATPGFTELFGESTAPLPDEVTTTSTTPSHALAQLNPANMTIPVSSATTHQNSFVNAGAETTSGTSTKPTPNEVPSPIPAGMVHIPETLPENERSSQPTLTELLSEPSSLLPLNAANIQWVQREKTVKNPFRTSNQPDVDYEDVGNKDDQPPILPHSIVIYMTNPFTWGTPYHTSLHMRVSLIQFIRTFNSLLSKIPIQKRPQLQLEIIGLEQLDQSDVAIPDYLNNPRIPMDLYENSANCGPINCENTTPWTGGSIQDVTRSLSIAVYTHPRIVFPEMCRWAQPRCMTAFGPGSELLRTIEELEKMNQEYTKALNYQKMGSHGMMMNMPNLPMMNKKGYFAFKVPSNIVHLSLPPPLYQMEADGKVQITPNDEQVLFVSYCLIGADFLVATVTDGLGKMMDNCVINMKANNLPTQLYRFKQKTQILDAMGKLWSFILGVMASDAKNWRLVVGRLGRIGHGEFRAWTHLLNKNSLLKYSSRLKDICAACNQMPGNVGTPAVLSACLVTIEPEPNLRIHPEDVDIDVIPKKNKQLFTPSDSSCTHILTFPVGAEINCDSQDQSSDPKAEENWEFGELDIMEGLDDGDTELLKDVGLTDAEMPTSAAIRASGYQSFFSDEASIDVQNQPLASGFYVSTAPAPELPDWFWAQCPSAKRNLPVHLKSSLHIHIAEVKNDDISMESSSSKEKEKEKENLHPLESHHTEEVLRHVLESYNALSWLNYDQTTGYRYSCLPIHIQHLLRLYHSIVRLIL